MTDPDQLRTWQASESKPVRVLGATAAALLAVVSGLALIPGVPGYVPAAVGVAGLGLTVFVSSLTENKTVPWQDTVAKVTPAGKVIAGPAAAQPTGTTVTVLTDVAPPAFRPGPSTDLSEGDPL